MESIIGGIFIVIVLGAFAAAIVRPWLAFVLIVAFPVIEQAIQGFFPFFITYRTVFNYVVASIVALTLLIRFTRDSSMLAGALNPVSKLIIVLQVLSYVSLLWTPEFENGFFYTVGQFPYTLLFMIMAPLLITSLDDFRRVRAPMMALGCLSLMVILLGPNARFYGARLMLIYSSTEQANALILAELGAVVLMFAVLTTQRGVGTLIIPLQLAAGMFGFGMGLLSGSRGQVMAGVLMAFLFFPVARKVKSTFGFLGIGLGILVVFMLLYLGVSLFITSENMDRWTFYSLMTGITGRQEIVIGTIEPWIRNPISWIFGRGAGAFISTGLAHNYPHNHMMEALTELGLVGLLVYMLILVFTIKALMGLFRLYRDDPEGRSCVAVLGATSAFFFLISLKQGTVHSPGFVMIWYLVVARVYWYEKRVHEVEYEGEFDPETNLPYEDDEHEEYDEHDEHEEYDEHDQHGEHDEHDEHGNDGLSRA